MSVDMVAMVVPGIGEHLYRAQHLHRLAAGYTHSTERLARQAANLMPTPQGADGWALVPLVDGWCRVPVIVRHERITHE